jgi:hypothetical protein
MTPWILLKNVHGKNIPKIHSSSMWGTYSCSVRYYVLYAIFLDFKKYQVSAQKLKELVFDFTDNTLFTAKTGRNLYLIPVRHIFLLGKTLQCCTQLFWGSKKHRVSVFLKNACSRWKHIENMYFIPVKPIFLLG